MKKNALGLRMKGYEFISRFFLMKKNPVIIRLDGVCFHTFTKGLKRPYDTLLAETMIETARYLCDNIQGARLGYTQSDEISIFLSDYEKIDTESWYHYNVQKLSSVSASMATLHFNRTFRKKVEEYKKNNEVLDENYLDILKSKIDRAIFDSRAFSLPKEEVQNYFVWRQQDATRNSIQMAGQYYFSHKQLQRKKCNDIQDMLINEKQINWNDYPVFFKRGTCITSRPIKIRENAYRNKWVIDDNIPIFTQEPGYINLLVRNK